MTSTPALLRFLLSVLGATIFHDAFAQPAQEPCPLPRPGAPVPFCRLDFVSTTGQTFEAPQYGRVMHQAGIGGMVRVSLVVDTAGRVVPGSVKQLDGPSRGLNRPTEEAVLRHRFAPPTAGGRPVMAVIEVEIEYVPGSDSVPSRYVLSTRRSLHGYRVRVGWDPIPRSQPAAAISAEDSLAVVLELLQHTVKPADSAGRALCLSVAWENPRPGVMAAVRQLRPGAVPRSSCPRTYDTWVISPGDPPRPPGALDPDHLDLITLTVWTADVVVIYLRQSRGPSGFDRHCDVIRSASGWQLDQCRGLARWVS